MTTNHMNIDKNRLTKCVCCPTELQFNDQTLTQIFTELTGQTTNLHTSITYSTFILKKTEHFHALQCKYEAYPQNKFHLQILPLQHCGHDSAHACRVCWSFGKARTRFADNRTAFTYRLMCLQCSRKSRSPPHVKCAL
jgi:hypothetical protein